jgi:hypothetical protein
MVYGISGWTAANYYETASPGGIAGVDTGFGVWGLIRVDSQAVASATRRIFNRSSSSATGWFVRTGTTNATLVFGAASGAGVGTTAPAYTITAGDVGKVIGFVGVHDGSNLRLYVNRVEVGSGTAITGYTPQSTATRIGARNTGLEPADNITILGCAGGHGVPSLAEVQALFDLMKSSCDVRSISGKTSSLWSAKRDFAGTTAPATLDDKSGSEDMSRVGSALTASSWVPSWGW